MGEGKGEGEYVYSIMRPLITDFREPQNIQSTQFFAGADPEAGERR
jgi:hypothetical protein